MKHKPRTLRALLLWAFLVPLAALGAAIGVLGTVALRQHVIGRAQDQVALDIKTARAVLDGQLDLYARAFPILASSEQPTALPDFKERMNLDYLRMEDVSEARNGVNPVVRQALAQGRAAGGVRRMPVEELRELDESLARRVVLEVKPTPKAVPTDLRFLEDALVLEHALPVSDSRGRITHVLYGGRILNGDDRLVDRIRTLVFDGRTFNGRPVGTVTFFLGDIRVATNVTGQTGERKLGTRVSEEVYRRVIEHGGRWTGRAFVVNEWYLTCYEPLRDPGGAVIGMLYVGSLEAPFKGLSRRLLGWFLLLLAASVAVAVSLESWLASAIARPVARLTAATAAVAAGDDTVAVESGTRVAELQTLAQAFGSMADELKVRRTGLERSNEELAAANQRYLDLVGFVAHELKGILASVILNAYAVRDGFLGIINFKQRRALDSVTRSLDYLDATVKNFLNLSRIERGQLAMNAADLALWEEVARPAVEEFTPRAEDRKMTLEAEVPPSLRVQGDQTMLQMVFHNLLGNAVNYGEPGGRLRVRAEDRGDEVAVEVYNDGEPLSPEHRDRLFQRFVRLDTAATRRQRGTGLGLFITREIVRQHGGDIRAEARERGNAFVFTLRKEIHHDHTV